MLAPFNSIERNRCIDRRGSQIFFKKMTRCFMFLLVGAWMVPVHAQQGAGPSALTARLINIEAVAKDPFRFNVTLTNGTVAQQTYALKAAVPDGWTALFRTEGSQVAAVQVDAAGRKDLSLEISATPFAEPGTYEIPVTAISGADTLRLELEAVVSGHYQLELTTPTGRLSDQITEGKSKHVTLTVKNTGTLPFDGLELSAKSPSQWNATFEPASIERLDPGQSRDVTATISVPDKTIAGDYITTFTAKNNHDTATATFRMTVKTSILSGWIGILVILAAVGMVYYLIRRYGRR